MEPSEVHFVKFKDLLLFLVVFLFSKLLFNFFFVSYQMQKCLFRNSLKF